MDLVTDHFVIISYREISLDRAEASVEISRFFHECDFIGADNSRLILCLFITFILGDCRRKSAFSAV